ncbi:MAG TPA: DegV family protein [Dehalococcoidia bacterium]|nr:DegV family protein [Dehalococcoidia bacterium]
MTVKIVTDTLSDITGDLTKDLDVVVVPLYVRFGEEIFRDRVEITTEEFYRRLVYESTLPSTTQPTPHDFSEVYNKLAKETDEILVITISSKLSGTYQSAMQAKKMFQGKAQINVVDSLSVAMGQGLIVISTVNAVRKGAGLEEATNFAQKAVSRSHLIAYFDTLKYLAKGGRIGKAQGLLGSMLSVKPILMVKDGEMSPLTRVRSLNGGFDYLFSVVANAGKLESLAVEHATTPGDADKLVERFSTIFPKENIIRSIISPVVGTHAGPNALAVSYLEAE